MNLRWTWVNFATSLLVNRLSFLLDVGLYHLYAWIALHPGSENYPNARMINFFASASVATAILSLLHLRPLHFGVLLPSQPGAAHILQDGQVVPLVDLPPQSLTRKVSFIAVQNLIQLILQVSAGTEGSPLPGSASNFCWCHLSLCCQPRLPLPIHATLASCCFCYY